jgi:hypothetical protein
MQLIDLLASENSIDLKSQEWERAVRQLHIQMSIDVDKLEFFKCIPCRFTLLGLRNEVKISERPGYFISAKAGILVVCVSTTDLPLTLYVERKVIRGEEHNKLKFMKAEILVKTNDESFVFKAPKKVADEIEKEVNRIRANK